MRLSGEVTDKKTQREGIIGGRCLVFLSEMHPSARNGKGLKTEYRSADTPLSVYEL